MSNVDSGTNLKSAMRETLEAAGQLDGIKAQLRAVVFQALDASSPESKSRPPMPPETMVINELIREYLQFQGYEHTASVMALEIGASPNVVVPRSVIAAQVGMREAPKEVPLLYSLLHEARQISHK